MLHVIISVKSWYSFLQNGNSQTTGISISPPTSAIRMEEKKWLYSLVHWDSDSLSNVLTSYSY